MTARADRWLADKKEWIVTRDHTGGATCQLSHPQTLTLSHLKGATKE